MSGARIDLEVAYGCLIVVGICARFDCDIREIRVVKLADNDAGNAF